MAETNADISRQDGADSSALYAKALELLNRHYGFSSFRPGQWEVIESVLRGRDAVVLMPTGGGKSLCFQLAALMSEGCCIVVSPLIALMKDQVEALRANGLPAAAINSFNSESENREIYRKIADGEVKMLYLSPERLVVDIEQIKKNLSVSFVAVDEAHCISQWGHDFRPVYTELSRIKQLWPDLPVMALTATADRLTREDIASALRLHDPYMHIGSFDRPNLSLRVIQGSTVSERVSVIAALISKNSMDCGIVYCLSRKKTEAMAERLAELGYRVACYHAGMDIDSRERVQREFVEGKYQAICATIAFGMGIDKSNIRWVVHNNIPGNIESYYQEIGRSGRDGMPAETILFYSYGDMLIRRKFVEESGQKEINESKLNFMQRYAESSVCRRRILLSYFSEEVTCDCGNCDNCRSPRARFDGTVHAQKALSAIVRTGSSEPISHIIDILRGSRNQHMLSRGYDRLPTYGVGADVDVQEWHAYILQMIQLGLIEVAYEDNFHLRPTPLGIRVLRGNQRIELFSPVRHAYAPARGWRARHTEQKPALSGDELLAYELKSMRKIVAEKRGIADYMVFSDATLAEIVGKNPVDVISLSHIEGMSMARLAAYYKDILGVVNKHVNGHKRLPTGSSDVVTRVMYENGMSVGEIAEMRDIQFTTALVHLINQIDAGLQFDCAIVLPPEKYLAMIDVSRTYNESKKEYIYPDEEYDETIVGKITDFNDYNDKVAAENKELMARLMAEHYVTAEESKIYRYICRHFTVEDNRYVRITEEMPCETVLKEPEVPYSAGLQVPEDVLCDETSDPDAVPFDFNDPDDALS